MDIGMLYTAFERELVHHCTPTLAALKPASLFSFPGPTRDGTGNQSETHETASQECFTEVLHTCRAKLAPHGIRVEVLARRPADSLIYVYRPNMLTRTLADPEITSYLAEDGYDTTSLASCIERLHRRINGTDLQSLLLGTCSFPHEIGFFLGYPYEDVIGFIENDGENFLCNGCWKVYTRERDAQACFCRYENCTIMYESLFRDGVSLEKLAAVSE